MLEPRFVTGEYAMFRRTSLTAFALIGFLSAQPVRAQLPAPNAAGVSSGHIHMMVRDPAAHKKLWVELFGAQVVQSGTLEMLKLPGVFLILTQGERAEGSIGSAIDHFALRVKDLAATSAKLKAAGVPLTRDDSLEIVASFPDKLKVEFYPAPTLTVPIEHFHVHFYAPDVDGLRAWYAKHFGAATPTATNPNAMGVPGMSFSFRKTDAAQGATKGRSLDHIGFEVKDLEAFTKKLAADGVTFEVPFRDVPGIGLKLAFLIDPAGTRIELTEGLAKR
jgi:catechol 2,3-dioxygenase-like lactoylglutathione lyase family enzyme